jgi:CheY-like chemotaxis protein/anti-sigma regulatory factor (Ser/Thr protein kinase)
VSHASGPARILVVDDSQTTRHLIRGILMNAGYQVAVAKDGVAALALLSRSKVDLVLCDIWMPRMNGLDLLAKLRTREKAPRAVVMTSDDTPETLLKAVREQAFQYVQKPVEAAALVRTIRDALSAPDAPAIEVISARPEWVELVVPCTHEAVERIQAVMAGLDTDLEPRLREQVAYAFRELLLNAIEWGGKLDPNRKVRISYLRAKRMLLYRIADPGPGFNIEKLPHAAIGRTADGPIAHMQTREDKGIRPGGFGLLMVRASVDELIHNEARNEVVFVKYL